MNEPPTFNFVDKYLSVTLLNFITPIFRWIAGIFISTCLLVTNKLTLISLDLVYDLLLGFMIIFPVKSRFSHSVPSMHFFLLWYMYLKRFHKTFAVLCFDISWWIFLFKIGESFFKHQMNQIECMRILEFWISFRSISPPPKIEIQRASK